jgi:DNA (cytosine-5)-methyltransferase 1
MRNRFNQNQQTFATLFCGCGGFDLGFHDVGFRCIGAFDNDPAAVDVYNENQRGRAALYDLSAGALSLPVKPDIVLAGPPCQGFSTLGKRRFTDPRNSLFVTAAKLAVGLGPRVIAIENVTGILSGRFASHFASAQQVLKDGGYETRVFKIGAKDVGLPQIRRRVVLVAAKETLDSVKLPIAQNARSMGDVLTNCSGTNHEPIPLKKNSDEMRIARSIGQNQKLCNVRGGERAVPTWEIPEVFGEVSKREVQLLELIRQLRRQIRRRPNGDADPVSAPDICEHVQWSPHAALAKLERKGYLRRIEGRYDFTHAFNGKYRRLSFVHDSPAVDTRFGQPRYFIHPEENRGMSVREAARIQGFPDTFHFSGSREEQYRLVGNAVPPPIGYWLAEQIKEKLL